MTTIQVHDRPVELRLSRAAQRALARREAPLIAEMELYFSCLIRKRVRFRERADGLATVAAAPGLLVAFRAVTTAQCRIADVGEEVPLTDMPVTRGEALVPRWLAIDYRRGAWQGEFGSCT